MKQVLSTRTVAPVIALALGALRCSTPIVHAGEPQKEFKQVETPKLESSDWQFNLGIPGWLAATSGTIGVDGNDADVYMGADTLIKNLDAIATFSGEVRKGRFGLYGDFLYVNASDGASPDGLVQKIDFRLDQYLADLELNYRIIEGPRGFLDVRAGVRYTNIYNEIAIQPDDAQIDDASANFVDALSERIAGEVRSSLGSQDLDRGALGRLIGIITDRIEGIGGERPRLPVAPLFGRKPDVIARSVERVVERRQPALRDAVRAEAAARAEEARVRARHEVTHVRAEIRNRVAAARAAARQRVDNLKNEIENEIATVLKDELDASASLEEYWFDPYVGIRARYNLSQAFYLLAKADVGGFGVGSDLTWQAYGGLGCQITRTIYAEAGYRYLYTDYSQNNFTYDVTQSGVQITVGINF